ncbi:GspH/FimT family pseudopilin [Desulfobotulus sp. H1]|uniref:Type II secretion system protein H n=1 Tax=Desulfobotulus pelophilus TaxID=2823377 RepID=A0ABT3NCP2_9BACT|nr:GspH/FimT family pseudopilin [Desulfobotulus pelophilus]MCW7755241.1 GspH/FimT family pseudopilin [Desulfobotulus pelophilus]
MGNPKGFTLVEIVVIIALLGIIAAIATPTFREARNNNHIKTATFTLGTAMSYARNEAITRGTSVTICRSANPNATDSPTGTIAPSCSTAAGTGWETGYIVFVDTAGDGIRNAGEELLRVFPPSRGNIVIQGVTSSTPTAAPLNSMTYPPTGFGRDMGGTITAGLPGAGGVDTSKTHFDITIDRNGRFTTSGPK